MKKLKVMYKLFKMVLSCYEERGVLIFLLLIFRVISLIGGDNCRYLLKKYEVLQWVNYFLMKLFICEKLTKRKPIIFLIS